MGREKNSLYNRKKSLADSVAVCVSNRKSGGSVCVYMKRGHEDRYCVMTFNGKFKEPNVATFCLKK